jgi:hypothetical protein
MLKKVNIVLAKALLFVLFLAFQMTEVMAQCAMCKGQLETHGDNSTSLAVNHGILYLLAMPFLLAGLIGFVVYRRSRQLQAEAES